MAEQQRLDLGLVDSIVAETFGQPGQRTFNLTARSERGRAVIWMEKEQLLQMALALDRFTSEQEAPGSPSVFVPEYAHAGAPVEIEFKVREMSLRYDGGTDTFTVEAIEPPDRTEDEEPPEPPENEDDGSGGVIVQFSFGRDAAGKLAEEGQKIVSAGRPNCPYCHNPINSDGHTCPRTNGHDKAGISLE